MPETRRSDASPAWARAALAVAPDFEAAIEVLERGSVGPLDVLAMGLDPDEQRALIPLTQWGDPDEWWQTRVGYPPPMVLSMSADCPALRFVPHAGTGAVVEHLTAYIDPEDPTETRHVLHLSGADAAFLSRVGAAVAHACSQMSVACTLLRDLAFVQPDAFGFGVREAHVVLVDCAMQAPDLDAVWAFIATHSWLVAVVISAPHDAAARALVERLCEPQWTHELTEVAPGLWVDAFIEDSDD